LRGVALAEEGYGGVRFKAVLLSREAPRDERLSRLAHWCRRFHESGLAPVVEGRSRGNLSFRLRSGGVEFMITASGLGPKDALDEGCFVKVLGFDLERNVVYASGLREPSSESLLHGRIYELRGDVNAVFHGHSQLILERAAELGLVETRRRCPYGSLDLVRSVEEVLDGEDFIVLKGHGFLSLGGTMDEAGERAMRILAMCRPHG
jgi:L-ribulose-5-phosphate 4-epimerase